MVLICNNRVVYTSFVGHLRRTSVMMWSMNIDTVQRVDSSLLLLSLSFILKRSTASS